MVWFDFTLEKGSTQDLIPNRMQRKKNIQLIVILTSLVVVLIALSFFDQRQERLDVPRDLFNLEDTNEINKVQFSAKNMSNELEFQNNQWIVNQKFQADRQRVTVLFSVLKQVKVRKKVAKLEQSMVDSLLQNSGVKVQFYSRNKVASEFSVAGNKENNITYFSDGVETYIVQIPGYNVYIADIFSLDENGWRDPLVINMDWNNLGSVEMIYPEKSDEAFKVDFTNRNFMIEGISQPDSARVGNFLDDVSTLYVNDYLFESELSDYNNYVTRKQATVLVTDVGRSHYSIEFFDIIDNNQILVRIDSMQYALIDYSKAKKILKPKSFFLPKRGDQ